MGLLESRSIVDTITGHGDDMAHGDQNFNKFSLVTGLDSAENLTLVTA